MILMKVALMANKNMDTNHKKVLIIHCDPDFAESILELLKKSEVGIVLAANLSEGEDILKKEKFGLVVIEYPVVMGTEILSKFILQANLNEVQVFLVAKEKRFLDDLDSRSKVSIFDRGELYNRILSFVNDTK